MTSKLEKVTCELDARDYLTVQAHPGGRIVTVGLKTPEGYDWVEMTPRKTKTLLGLLRDALDMLEETHD